MEAGAQITEEQLKTYKEAVEQNRQIAEWQEKARHTGEAIGSAINNSLGGSLGSIAQSFGKIGDAQKVLSSGTASAAEMDAATASAAAGWIAIADEVSKIAKQIYDIGTSTGDWGEAFETAIIGVLEQIPIIGSWLAEIVDNLWKTGTETLDELQAQQKYLEAAGKDTTANIQSQIVILQDQLSKTTDITAQYELQTEILKLQKELEGDILDAIEKRHDIYTSMYQTAADFHLDTGDYAMGWRI
jgi:hypothetical protein